MAQIVFLVGAGLDCQYADIASAWAAIPADVVGSGNSYRLELDKTAVFNLGTATLALSGKTTSAVNNIWIGPRVGHGFNGNANILTTAFTYNEANGVAIRGSGNYYSVITVSTNHVTLSGLQVYNAGGGNNGSAIYVSSNITGTVIDNCITKVKPTGNQVYGVWCGGTNCPYTLRNTLIITDSANSGGVYVPSFAKIENVTVVRPSAYAHNAARPGFSNIGNDGDIRNSLVVGGPFANTDRTFTGANNASTGTILNGTNNLQNLVATDLFVDPAGDFRTKAGATIINAGAAPSAGSVLAPSGARLQGTAADIGAWEYPQGADTLSLSGAASVYIGEAITITVTANGNPAAATTITFSDNGGGGSFNPPSVVIGTSESSKTTQYTAGSAGPKSISITSSPSMTLPTALAVQAQVKPPSGTVTSQPPPDGQSLVITFSTTGTPTSGTAVLNKTGGGTHDGVVALASGSGTATYTGIPDGTHTPVITLTNAGGNASVGGLQPFTILGISGEPEGPEPGGEPPVATVTSVVVTPSNIAVSNGAPIDFDAAVNGDNNPSQGVTWSADGGSIDSNGTLMPPTRTFLIQTITITATSTLDPTKKGYATVIILALPIPTEGNPMAQQVDLSQLINQTQLGPRAQRALSMIVESLIDDRDQLRAGLLAIAGKLDQDAGVTDANYSTSVAAALGNVVVVK